MDEITSAEAGRRAWANLTADERSEINKRRWETRRENAEQRRAEGQ